MIGVDGGGTKITASLADLKGNILKTRVRKASANPRNVGTEKAVDNTVKIIKKIIPPGKNIKVEAVLVGMPAVAEEFRVKRGYIKRELRKKLPEKLIKKIEVVSDQEVAFRAGTDEKRGILIIAGTGCVVRGWKGKRKAHSNGWGWLADEGSAFFVGQRVFQKILKDLDGRGAKTLLTKIAAKELAFEKGEDLARLVYSQNPTEIIPLLSVVCDKASKRGDKTAVEIMTVAAEELFLAAGTVIKKLKFENSKFPLVLVGGMFKSDILLDRLKKNIKKLAPKVRFIKLKQEPVIGAIKLVLEELP